MQACSYLAHVVLVLVGVRHVRRITVVVIVHIGLEGVLTVIHFCVAILFVNCCIGKYSLYICKVVLLFLSRPFCQAGQLPSFLLFCPCQRLGVLHLLGLCTTECLTFAKANVTKSLMFIVRAYVFCVSVQSPTHPTIVPTLRASIFVWWVRVHHVFSAVTFVHQRVLREQQKKPCRQPAPEVRPLVTWLSGLTSDRNANFCVFQIA